jgi:hypothetical protein
MKKKTKTVTLPIVVRWHHRTPFVISAFAGKTAQELAGFGSQVWDKEDFLHSMSEWFDTMMVANVLKLTSGKSNKAKLQKWLIRMRKGQQ